MGKVLAVCTSDVRGVQKKNIHEVDIIENFGLEGDAHAGKWHRQVSLLSHEKIEEFRARGAKVDDGAFGENLVVSGIDFAKLPLGTHFRIGDVELELTQIGKKCHNGCAIYKIMGDCIMPREGVFTRVLHGGHVREGDEVTVILPEEENRPADQTAAKAGMQASGQASVQAGMQASGRTSVQAGMQAAEKTSDQTGVQA